MNLRGQRDRFSQTRRGAVADYAFRVVIAPSYADIFYNNCLQTG